MVLALMRMTGGISMTDRLDRSAPRRRPGPAGPHARSRRRRAARRADRRRGPGPPGARRHRARPPRSPRDALRAGGRLGYAGAGSSGVMALADALELPGTFGLAPDRAPVLLAGGAGALLHMTGAVEDDAAAAAADLARAGLAAGDALVVVSASGTTPYALAVAEAARARGVAVIAIANVADSPLLRARRRRRAAGHRRGSGGRLDPDGGRHGTEDRAQHALDADGAAPRPRPRRADGQPRRRQRQAARPRRAHRRRDRRRDAGRGRGGARRRRTAR